MQKIKRFFLGPPAFIAALMLLCLHFILENRLSAPWQDPLWECLALAALPLCHHCYETFKRRQGLRRFDPRLLALAAAAIMLCRQDLMTSAVLCLICGFNEHLNNVLRRFLTRDLLKFQQDGPKSYQYSDRELKLQNLNPQLTAATAVAAFCAFAWDAVPESAAAVLVSVNTGLFGMITACAFMSAMSALVDRGVWVRSRAALEHLGESTVFITDKNGTLTDGKCEVTDVIALKGVTEDEVAQLAASAELACKNRIGAALIREAVRRGLKPLRADNPRFFRHRGCYVMIEGTDYQCGNDAFLRQSGKNTLGRISDIAQSLRAKGKTVIFLADGARVIGIIALKSTVRPRMRDLVEIMRDSGHEIALLSADAHLTVKSLGAQAGIMQTSCDMSAEQKSVAVAAYAHDRGKGVMVLTHDIETADVSGVACAFKNMGPQLCSHAAVVSLRDDPAQLALGYLQARRALRAARLSCIAWAAAQIFLAAVSFFGLVSPLGASLSCLLCGTAAVICGISASGAGVSVPLRQDTRTEPGF
ncbi:MAG: HAD family hydrolase [Succinivibrio sp.]|jgi:cation transport ATPase|nr:HAD family hydrolase [Succinivibrio sp.]